MATHSARARDARTSGARAGTFGCLLLLSALALACLPAAAQDSAFVAAMREGRAAYKANDWVTAEKHFDAAAKASENDRQKSTAFYALGVVAQKQNKLPEAKQRAEQALAINPGDKLSKGLLDEVNAASVPPTKGKGKPASKGLAKTPYEPGSKQAASAAAAGKAGQPRAAGDTAKAAAPKGVTQKAPAAKPAAPANATPAIPPGKASALEAPAIEHAPSTAVAAVAQPAQAEAAPVDAKSVDQPLVAADAAKTVPATEAGHAVGRPSDTATASIVAPIVTGALPEAIPVSAAIPGAPGTSPEPPVPVEVASPLPRSARYVEMSCGPDYRADGKLFARALELTGGAEGEGEVLAFDVACSARNGAPVPLAEVITGDGGDQIRLTRLQRAPGGGWMFVDDAGVRLARFRPEADALVLLPSDGEVAILRRQLAHDPAQLNSLSPDVRRDLERAVSGDGYPEFRLVRASDRLDSAFDRARKLAKRIDASAAFASTN